MTDLQRIPYDSPDRVETGPVQFGDDWPGVFIRGDNAIAYALALQALVLDPDNGLYRASVKGLIRLLQSSNVRNIARTE